jgi:O-antigen/teichoic acid export membrane protein
MSSPSTPVQSSLRSRMLGATQWVVMASGFGHVLRLLSNLVLTRLLVPEMFGLMAIGTTVSVIVAMLSDIGLRQAVVRSARGDEQTFLDTAWTIQVGQGLVLWAGTILVAMGLYVADHLGWVSEKSAYSHPILPWVIAAIGFVSVINGFSSTLAATSIRKFELRRVFLLDFGGQIFGLLVTVGLAWWSRSIWALVIGSVASVGLSSVLSHVWMKGPRNWFRWEKAAVTELFSYGKWLMLSSSVTVFATNGDRLMLAGLANAYFLGLYSVALSLVGALDTILTQLFDKVMLPAFSEVARNNPAGVPSAYFRLRKRIDPIILLSSGMLFGAAYLIIGVLYDKRYAEAAHMLQILSLGMIVSRYALVQQVYLAIGQTRYFVPLNVVRLISTYVFIPLGYYLYGFDGALVAIAVRDLPSAILTFVLNTRHGLNNLRLELSTLVFWPLGYAVAQCAVWVFSFWRG